MKESTPSKGDPNTGRLLSKPPFSSSLSESPDEPESSPSASRLNLPDKNSNKNNNYQFYLHTKSNIKHW